MACLNKKNILFATRKNCFNDRRISGSKFGPKLEKEQEVLVNIADIVSNVYAMESALLRTEKAIAQSGAEKNKQKYCIHKFSAKRRLTKLKRMRKKRSLLWNMGTCCA